MKLNRPYFEEVLTTAKDESRNIILGLTAGSLLAASEHPAALLAQWCWRKTQPLTLLESQTASVAIASLICTALLLWLLPATVKWLRSLKHGVTHGMFFIPMAVAFLGMTVHHLPSAATAGIGILEVIRFIRRPIWAKAALIVSATLVILIGLKRPRGAKRRGCETDISLDQAKKSIKQDRLERRPLVEKISRSMIGEGKLTYALYGEFGSGKSSLLNFIEEYLKKNESSRVIVVRFNGWLPGSPDDLSEQLLADIATECRRKYWMPGLSVATLRLARAFASDIPYAKWLPELATTATQQGTISEVRGSLERLPERIVVLVDEIDRMGKDELLGLLKLIKGCDSLPNLTFLCAMDRETVEGLVKDGGGGNLYLQKFFGGSFWLPKTDDGFLLDETVAQLSSSLEEQDWFRRNSTGKGDYTRFLMKHWRKAFSPFCTNLRAIARMRNALQSTAKSLTEEVSIEDLTLITLLQQFAPEVHDIIWDYRDTLTAAVVVRETDEGIETFRHNVILFFEALAKLPLRPKMAEATIYTVALLFSGLDQIHTILQRSHKTGTDMNNSEVEREWRYFRENISGSKDKRLRSSSYFTAYFQGTLQNTIFPEAKMDSVLDQLTECESAEDCSDILAAPLMGIPIIERRLNFLQKLANKAATALPQPRLAQLATIIVDYASTSESAFDRSREYQEIARLVCSAADVTGLTAKSLQAKIDLLNGCIARAREDDLALRILNFALYPPAKHQGVARTRGVLNPAEQELVPAFLARMNTRYGHADLHRIRLESVPATVFDTWGKLLQRPEWAPKNGEENPAVAFWRRYLVTRERLAAFVEHLLAPLTSEPYATYPEWIIPKADLQNRLKSLPDKPDVPDEVRQRLDLLANAIRPDVEADPN